MLKILLEPTPLIEFQYIKYYWMWQEASLALLLYSGLATPGILRKVKCFWICTWNIEHLQKIHKIFNQKNSQNIVGCEHKSFQLSFRKKVQCNTHFVLSNTMNIFCEYSRFWRWYLHYSKKGSSLITWSDFRPLFKQEARLNLSV